MFEKIRAKIAADWAKDEASVRKGITETIGDIKGFIEQLALDTQTAADAGFNLADHLDLELIADLEKVHDSLAKHIAAHAPPKVTVVPDNPEAPAATA